MKSEDLELTAEPEQTEPAEPAAEPAEPENDYLKQIEEIKNDFAQKLEAAKADANKKIKERDEVIKQLLTGDAKQTEPDDIILDRINKKRNFKKW